MVAGDGAGVSGLVRFCTPMHIHHRGYPAGNQWMEMADFYGELIYSPWPMLPQELHTGLRWHSASGSYIQN